MKIFAYLAATLILCGCCRPSPSEDPSPLPVHPPINLIDDTNSYLRDNTSYHFLDETTLYPPSITLSHLNVQLPDAEPVHIHIGVIHNPMEDFDEYRKPDISGMYLIDDRNMK